MSLLDLLYRLIYPYYDSTYPIGAMLLLGLIILLAALSRIILKEGFSSIYWKILFAVSIVFSVIAIGFSHLSTSGILPQLLNRYVEADESMGYLIGAMMLNFGSFVFFICYLINFLVRLVHHRKQKNRVAAD
ncbi:MAG TPA: hypothetical protein PKD52_04805 [Clostridiales bacterium]|nr:hypothetical protein [Clostridiales bacterium]